MRKSFMLFLFGAVTALTANETLQFADAATNSSIVNACADKKTGGLRYTSSGSCKKTEKPLAWNVSGVEGAQGKEGPQGLQGPRGATGEQGPRGVDGSAAAQGIQGPTGPVGPTGATGATGASGITGPIGPGSLTYLSATSIRTGNSPGTYTTIYSDGQGVALEFSCFTKLSGGYYVYSLRGKAPTGTVFSGFVSTSASSAFSAASFVSNGTLNGPTTYGASPPMENSGIWVFDALGPDIDPIHLNVHIINSTTCEARGYVQTGSR